MSLIANSKFAYAGKKYLPGQTLPEAPPETVETWVKIGYAVRAKGPRRAAADEAPDTGPLPVPDKSMSTEELKALALRYGVDAGKKKTKDEIIAMIEATGKVVAA